MNAPTDKPAGDGETARAWVELPSPPELQERMKDHPYYRTGSVPAMAQLLAAHPRIWPLFGPLYMEIMFSPKSALSRAEREMIAAAASAAQDCFY